MMSLSIHEMVAGARHFVQTIWEIDLASGKVKIWHDSARQQLNGSEIDYETIEQSYRASVYPPDLEKWDSTLSLAALRAFAKSGEKNISFEMRFNGQPFGFEWHEAFLDLLDDGESGAGRVLLTSQYIDSQKRAHIVEAAVSAEYDYVVYIDADRNSYVMYSANQENGTPTPPLASNDYEREVVAFHEAFVPADEREELNRSLMLANVLPILEENDEYIVYCKVAENGKLRDKKMRFSYYNRERNMLLLTRTDVSEVREVKRQRELLEDALHAANVANRAKSDFLSRMSHDIRTPMNAIIGMTAIAGAHIDSRERVLDCLEKISASSKLLLSLINETLDMAKIESGRITLAEEEISLGDLLQNVGTIIRPAIAAKGHRFDVHVHELRHELVIGDMQRIQQVFLNILSNAVKYTPEHGHIVLDIAEKLSPASGYGLYEFVFQDNGVGIKPEFLSKVFAPFERAEDPDIRTIQGTGLGMAICDNIVRMMNGTIKAESEFGRGSRFTVTIQLRLREQDMPDVRELTALPILVADDDPITCECVSMRLGELGMTCRCVGCGAEAVAEVTAAHEAERDYFAAILDLRMPGMNGIETARRIRASVGPDMPIILISAYDWSECEAEAHAAGIDGFITKPLLTSNLIYMLRKYALKEEPRRFRQLDAIPAADYSFARILLVEDNELNREIAAELLSGSGAEIDPAENGREALERFAAAKPGTYDLILMDIQMPVMDGMAATRAIRALDRPDAKTVPIVAMTANAFEEDRKAALQAGMDEFIAKPIDLQKVFSVLSALLKKNR